MLERICSSFGPDDDHHGSDCRPFRRHPYAARRRLYRVPPHDWSGPATIQALGLVLLVPTILILAVTNALSKEILATLLGGVAGYIFGRASLGDGSDRSR
jgi:hypothetical protein